MTLLNYVHQLLFHDEETNKQINKTNPGASCILLCCNLPLDISHRTLMSLMHVQFVLRYSDAVCLPVYFFVPLLSDMSGREGGFSEYLSARLESGSWSNEAADRIWVSAADDKDEEDLVGVLGVGGPLVSIKIINKKRYLGFLPVIKTIRVIILSRNIKPMKLFEVVEERPATKHSQINWTEEFHQLKSQVMFSKAPQTEWQETSDFLNGIFGFPM